MNTQTNKPLTAIDAAHEYANQQHPILNLEFNAFKAGAEWQKEQGFIKWYSVDKDGFPPVGESEFCKKHGYSDEFLIYNEELKISDFGTFLPAIKHCSHRNGNWQPTHYAYINYPE